MRKIKVATGVLLAAFSLDAAVFNVREFGAKGDGSTKDTAAIQRAVDAAHAAGGGEVLFDAGVYLSGSVYLKSNVDFHLGAGAVLKASPDREDYNRPDVCVQNWTSKAESQKGAHLLLCIEQENVTVRGPGKIDGNSKAFLIDPATSRTWGFSLMARYRGQGDIPWRPSQMLYFVESRNIRVTDMELADSPYWTIFFHGCEQVAARGLYIHNERDRFHTHNGDGIDIDSCRFVTVSDCRIYTADDCITLRADQRRLKKKRDCAYITVSNCILSSPCNSVRVGVGDGDVHDATFTGITVHNTRTAINFVSSWKADAVDGVDFRNIQFSNWTVDCRYLFILYAGPLAEGVKRKSSMRDILFADFSGASSFGGMIHGSAADEWKNIRLSNIKVPVGIDIKNAEVEIEGGSVYREASRPVFDVLKSGAKGDGISKDTLAIQKAIDSASAAGGGTVLFPAGTYLSGTIFLKSDVKLEFKKGAVLKASPDREDYCAADAFAQNFASDYDNTSGGHLIVAVDCTNIALTGQGTIDGNSAAFLVDAKGRQYDNWKKGIPWRPGQMIYIVDSRNIVIEGLELVNSPYWTCFLLNNEKVTVQDCRIRTERKKYRTWNGDGIDIDRCRDVYVTRCDIDTEDDCIALRASCAKVLRFPQECRNVRVERCRLSSRCNAIRIGVGEGTVRDCHLSQIDVHNTATAVNIISAYTSASRGTDIRDITLASVQGECDRFLSLGYGRKKGDAKEAVIEDITFQDIRVTAKEKNDIREESSRPFGNIIFDDAATR